MPVNVETVIFFLLAAIAIGAALGLLLSRNAVHSALFLVLNFAVVSVFFLFLSAPFIAMVQVTVYAGAIMVLFLFVIMLLGAELLRGGASGRWHSALAVALAAGFVGVLGYVAFFSGITPEALPNVDAGFGGPQSLGMDLFQAYLLPFELTSLLLLVAMIGAVVLTRDARARPAARPGARP